MAPGPLAGIAEVRAGWSRLAEASGNPFATPEWCETWLDHIGRDCRVRLFGERNKAGSLIAIAPLAITRGRYVRKARLLGFGPSNELGPISSPAHGEAATELLRHALAETSPEWDVFLGEYLPGEGWAPKLGARRVRRTASPVVRGRWQSWDDYLATRSSGFRQELGRKERRLQERGLCYRDVTDDLEPALDALFELHRARWGDQASRWFAGQEPFQRAFSRAAFERGWLRLRILELDGRPAAVYHGFRFGVAEWSHQFGRDPAYDDLSVGLLVTAHAVRRAFEEGAAEFHLGPGAQPYKFRFATEDPGLETVGLARTLRGRASLVAEQRR
jgi:CelD/BcsL family acetyltransferase involved in cellulose biosynthesis